jgi:mono/diheme cytochrome c family protein
MPLPRGRWLPLLALFVFAIRAGAADVGSATLAHGQALFLANCSMCHHVTGIGAKGVYPPLAGSDFLKADRARAIRAVVAGLKDEIVVNGETYHGQMPVQMLDDAEVADVLTFVLNSWGNAGGTVTAAEVTDVRAKTDFKTFADLKAAGDFRPLPTAPAGFTLTELVRLPDFATRLASNHRNGRLYILGAAGSVWRFDRASGAVKQILWPKDFVGLAPVEFQTLGLMLDGENRLWITVNQRVATKPVETNEAVIFRTTALDAEGDPVAPRVWFQTSYPYGISWYNHGISDLQIGPDGMLYVSSGARTDGGEPGNSDNFGKMGEVDITACIWRLDPTAAQPKLEVIARGIRNAYTFGWDGAGRMFSASNGPDANAPEEMDVIIPPKAGEPPRHHGFPYQYADAPAEKKWYPHTPAAPPGMKFVPPVINLGPAALVDGQPTSTFTPHSSPVGLTWLGAEWPASVRNSFLMGRFGNLAPDVKVDVGFDLLAVKLEQRADGAWVARTQTLLAPLARPLDVHVAGPGRIYILEYTRPISSKFGSLPGRILELAVKPAAR